MQGGNHHWDGNSRRHQLCNDKRVPNRILAEYFSEEIRNRQDQDELPEQGKNHTLKALADRLEYRADRDTNRREDKADAHNAKRVLTDLIHGVRRVKNREKLMGKELENQCSHNHNRRGDDTGKL